MDECQIIVVDGKGTCGRYLFSHLSISSYTCLRRGKSFEIFENKGSDSISSEEGSKGIEDLYLCDDVGSPKSLLVEIFRTFRICDLKDLEYLQYNSFQ